MSEQNNFGSFFAGFIVGGLTGAIVSLLFAPQSGEETRAIIKDKAIELSEKASETFDEVSTKAGTFAKGTYQKAEEFIKEKQQQ